MASDKADRMRQLRDLEGTVPPMGWKPSYEAMAGGRREFAGMIDGGLWRGHEILVLVYGPEEPAFEWLRGLFRSKKHAGPRPLVESGYSFSADYWRVDPQAQGGDESDMCFTSLTELEEWIADDDITWYGPVASVDAVGKMLP